MPRVLHLFRSPKSGWPMEELAEVSAIQEMGFEGCDHAHPGRRQVLLVDRETLDALELSPGMIRENITTEGPSGERRSHPPRDGIEKLV